MIAIHNVARIPIARVREAPWNANKVAKKMMERIRRSLETYGVVENAVLRPSWTIGAHSAAEIESRRFAQMGEPEFYETLSGNHRLRILRDSGATEILAAIVELPDAPAKVLAQALNRTRGAADDPDKLTALLKDVLADLQPTDVAALLPHTARDLLKILKPDDDADDELPEGGSGPPDSKTGRIYVLGPHRLLCGDATDRGLVESFLGHDKPIVMATDPPYGVELDQSWRDEAGMERDASATANADEIEGDDGLAWEPALGIVPVKVAYVWHASKYTVETLAMLVRVGFEQRQMIVWNKDSLVIGRAHYHWKHEIAWYVSRPGGAIPWHGGRNQVTVWNAKSPRQLLGNNRSEDRLPHPTQKPVAIYEPPVLNHLMPGEFAYDPFAGSGTLMAACAKTGRRALMVEKSPKYCDVIRRRWTKIAGEQGVTPGPDALA